MKGQLSQQRSRGWRLLAPAAVCVAAGLAAPAGATVTSGTSTGFGASSNLSIAGGVSMSMTAGPVSTGTAPPVYNITNNAASASTSAAVLGSFTTGALTSSASSTVNGTAGSRNAAAGSTAANVNVNVLAGITNLLFGATNVTASASVTGDFGGLVQTGSVSITGGSLSVLGQAISFSSSPGANSTVFTSAGLTIVLNEQILSGNGISSRGLIVNAVHITFNNFAAGAAVVSGSIIIGHAEASLNAVPSPGAATLAAAACVAFVRRRRSA